MLLQLFVLFVVQSNFSIWPIMVKSVCANGQLNPMQLAIIKDGLGCVFLWISLWLQKGRPTVSSMISSIEDKRGWELPEMKIFLLLSLFSFLNTNAYMFSLNYVTSFNASLFHPTVPVFAAVLGVVLKVEEMTMWKIISATLCILGSLLVVLSHEGDDHFSSSLLGNFLLILHCSAMSGLLVFQKFLPPGYSSLHISTVYFTLGTLLTIPLCVAAVAASTGFASVSPAAWAVGIFGSFIIIIFNYTCMNWTTKTASPSLTASSMMLQPPLTFIYSSIIEGQQPVTAVEIVGAIVIIIGLLCSVLSPHAQRGPAAEVEVDGIALSSMHTTSHGTENNSSSGGSGAGGLFGSKITYTSVSLSSPSSHGGSSGDSSVHGLEDNRMAFAGSKGDRYVSSAGTGVTSLQGRVSGTSGGMSGNDLEEVDLEIQSISANSSNHSLYFDTPGKDCEDRHITSIGATAASAIIGSGGNSRYRRVGSSSSQLNNVSTGGSSGSPENISEGSDNGSSGGGTRTSPARSGIKNAKNND